MTKLEQDHERRGIGQGWLGAALLLAISAAFLLTGLLGCSSTTPVATSTPTEVPTPTSDAGATPSPTREPLIPLDDDPVLGSPDAPVTIIEYSDYLCPYCAQFATVTMRRIEEEYIDKGQAKLVFRDFPVHGQVAILGAMVAECAGEQGEFWKMHVLVFERAEEWSQSEDLMATLRGYADQIGIDGAEFESCLRDGTPLEGIQEDYNLAIQDGVTGTPSFLINGNLVVGALPFEEFQRLIEEQLAGSR